MLKSVFALVAEPTNIFSDDFPTKHPKWHAFLRALKTPLTLITSAFLLSLTLSAYGIIMPAWAIWGMAYIITDITKLRDIEGNVIFNKRHFAGFFR